MKLLLTSGGFTNKSIVAALEDLAGRATKELSLVFIPTAQNPEEGDKQWLINDLHNCKNAGFKYIDIVDFSAIPKAVWQPRLEVADVLLFGGGVPSYLNDKLKQSGLSELMPRLLETKVYVGISAGSMVVGPAITPELSERFFQDNLEGNQGWTNFWIKPHLNAIDLPDRTIEKLGAVFKDSPVPIYALDDQSALKVGGDQVAVVSEGQWHKFEAV